MLCRIGPSWWGQSVIMIFSFSSLPAHTVLYSQLYRSSLLYKSCLLYIRPLFSHFFRSRPSTQATPQYTATLLSLFSSFSYYRPCHNGIKGAGIRGRALEILLSTRPEPDLLPTPRSWRPSIQSFLTEPVLRAPRRVSPSIRDHGKERL